jgi:LmeA-like phospholipid-binding
MNPRRARRGCGPRALIVVLVLLAGLLVVADRAAEAVAEDRLATTAQQEALRYDVKGDRPDVEIGGTGFLPQLVRGEFKSVTMTMKQPTISSVPVDDLTVAMAGIQVPRELLTGGAGGTITADTANMLVRLPPESLTRLAIRTSGLEGLTLRVVDGKLQARVMIQDIQAVATVQPQVVDGRIRLTVDDLGAGVPVTVRDALNSMLSGGFEVPCGATRSCSSPGPTTSN